MNTSFFAAVAVLVLWTSVVLIWMVSTRWPAMKRSGNWGENIEVGARGHDFASFLPEKVMWKSHNYTHLLEQPSIFYAIAIIHGLMGSGVFDLALVWAYVLIRIIHSIWQGLINIVSVRAALFMLSDALLAILAVRVLVMTI